MVSRILLLIFQLLLIITDEIVNTKYYRDILQLHVVILECLVMEAELEMIFVMVDRSALHATTVLNSKEI